MMARAIGDSCCHRHENGSQAITASCNDCFVTRHTILAKIVNVVYEYDSIVHDYADKNHDANGSHEGEGCAGRGEEQEDAENRKYD